VGHAARWEYFRVIYGRYSKAKGAMLDEFCLNTGYHRTYAIRLLNGQPWAAMGYENKLSALSHQYQFSFIREKSPSEYPECGCGPADTRCQLLSCATLRSHGGRERLQAAPRAQGPLSGLAALQPQR
jgi:hypothetical protein